MLFVAYGSLLLIGVCVFLFAVVAVNSWCWLLSPLYHVACCWLPLAVGCGVLLILLLSYDVTYCVLFVVCCEWSLFVGCYWLLVCLVVGWLLLFVCCLSLFVVCCLLSIACCCLCMRCVVFEP